MKVFIVIILSKSGESYISLALIVFDSIPQSATFPAKFILMECSPAGFTTTHRNNINIFVIEIFEKLLHCFVIIYKSSALYFFKSSDIGDFPPIRRMIMAKGQKKSGREAKKPKMAKKARVVTSAFTEPLPAKKKPSA